MNRIKRKSLGQHFLKNPRIIKKIVQVINPEKDDFIIEIGPGKGALTVALAEKAGKVVAVEKDPNLVQYLKEQNLKEAVVIQADILKVSLSEIIDEEKKRLNKVKLVGNLPYSISSPILFKAFSEKEKLPFWTFMLQEEVADRLICSPGTKNYSPLTIIFQNYFEIKKELHLQPGSFQPPPKVNSTLLSFKKRKLPLYSLENEEEFLNFLRICFKQRRKTLWNNLLAGSFQIEKIKQAYQKLKLKKNIRAEQMEISQLVELHYFFLNNTEE